MRPLTSASVTWIVITFFGGACMTLQARINGELATRIDHGIVAALVSFATGLVLVSVVALAAPSGRAGVRRGIAAVREGRMPWWYALSGLFGAYFVTTQGLTVGLLGVALFTVGAVAGQTVSGLLVDRIGFGVLRARPVTVQRVIGGVLALGAVAIAVGGTEVSKLALVVLPFTAGLGQAFQQALGGQVQYHSGSAIAQTLSNFAVGTPALALVVGITVLCGWRPAPLPAEPWLFFGGVLGAIFIAVAAVAVHSLGVLVLSLTLIAGQVTNALLLDLVWPAAGHDVGAFQVIGAMLAIAAVAVSTVRRRA